MTSQSNADWFRVVEHPKHGPFLGIIESIEEAVTLSWRFKLKTKGLRMKVTLEYGSEDDDTEWEKAEQAMRNTTAETLAEIADDLVRQFEEREEDEADDA